MRRHSMTQLSTIEKWYCNASIEVLEEVFGVKHYEFAQDYGYQDFFDWCDREWDKLIEEEKREIYECFS